MGSLSPRTPTNRTGKGLDLVIEELNRVFDLQIPNPTVESPGSRAENDRSLGLRCGRMLKFVFWTAHDRISRIMDDFEDEVRASTNQWVAKAKQDSGTVPSSSSSREQFLRTDQYRSITGSERERRLQILARLLEDETYLKRGGSFPQQATDSPRRPRDLANGPARASDQYVMSGAGPSPTRPETKRKSSGDEEVFLTAPNSPDFLPHDDEGDPFLGNQDEFEDPELDDSVFIALDTATDRLTPHDDQRPRQPKKRQSKKRQSHISDYMNVAKLRDEPDSKEQTLPALDNDSAANTSFATTVAPEVFDAPDPPALGTSFGTDITEPMDDAMTQASSTDVLMRSEDMSNLLRSVEEGAGSTTTPVRRAQDDISPKLLQDLLQNGPFVRRDQRDDFPRSVSLRCRYELERIRQEWKLDPTQILRGHALPWDTYEDLWKWLERHSQRHGKPLPEKSSAKAWKSAVNRYKVEDKHSEAVVLSGALDWCHKDEDGVFKIRLHPLRIERTCRFYRRFGSDRFLSITIPAPSQPPPHYKSPQQPAMLRETVAHWLVHHDHCLLGRTWKAFFVEEVKTKNKAKQGEKRFRVDFFAVDGVDFEHHRQTSPSLSVADQHCEGHTPMTIEQLLNWHIPRNANLGQSDCKLFNRIGLGLSKTWATVVLRPKEILPLPDEPGRRVMNDGCALMSRALAREICTNLGLDEITPSCFQGRIAGAKGLWMVDRHNSTIQAGERDFWIQVSDSQLKIQPHPFYTLGTTDNEKLTFEVTGWSKPLRPVELNMQLLNILEHGGQIREHVAEIMRNAIQDVYAEFATVIEKDSPALARSLVQKLRPQPEEGFSRNSFRRVDQWILHNTESIIRYLEAGFSPRQFGPLKTCLWRCLTDTLNRYVDDLHVPIPLSTYAYCIADPYGILAEDEVHFGFSGPWKDAQFEDAMLDGVDILVGRLPAHQASDIQKRRAVWKHGLRHFKDVIVFSTRGDTPLANRLSGGDYDGDKPWICWDERIVGNFTNSDPPPVAERPPDFFGLVQHARPMREVESTEDFLAGTFKFNLTMSNLGQCTVEHEKIIYDEAESITAPAAQELAILLSHLVDSRKAGRQLPRKAWQQYRKKISPRERSTPAYKDPNAKRGKASNIIDFLKFEVAEKEKERVLTQYWQLGLVLGGDGVRDQTLVRPWQIVWVRAERERSGDGNRDLSDALIEVKRRITQAKEDWSAFCLGNHPFASVVQFAANVVDEIPPPVFDHPLSHTWSNSEHEWRRLKASALYETHWKSKFVWYAMGESLCQLKTENEASRLVRDTIYYTMKVSSKVARRQAAAEVDEDVETNEERGSELNDFDGESAILALDSTYDEELSLE